MPRIRPGMPRPPAGLDAIASRLDEFEAAMRDAVAAPSTGTRRVEALWAVAQVNRDRTRFVFDAFRTGTISESLLHYCGKVQWIDGELIKLWNIPGYERACCTACVRSADTAFGTVCACRVPRAKRAAGELRCAQCGCSGCASCDGTAAAAVPSHRDKVEVEEEEDGALKGGNGGLEEPPLPVRSRDSALGAQEEASNDAAAVSLDAGQKVNNAAAGAKTQRQESRKRPR